MNHLKVMWPSLSIAHGKSRHSHKAQWGLTSSVLPASISSTMSSEDDIEATQSTGADTALHTQENVEATLSSIETTGPDDHPHNEQMGTRMDFFESDNQDEAMWDRLRHQIKRNQAQAFEGLQSQAKRMKAASEAEFGPLDVGACVTITVPNADRSKSDA